MATLSDRDAKGQSSGATYSTMEALSRDEIILPPRFYLAPMDPATEWLDDARRELKDLKILAPGWDSYGAREVSSDAIDRARDLLHQLASDVSFAPRPTIVPSTEGGVRLQWHEGNIYIVVEVDPSGPTTLYYEESTSEPPWEGTLGDEPKALVKLLWEASNF